MGAIENVYTYDTPLEDGGPYVPDLAALGGEDFEDDAQTPPAKGTDPYAGLYSEHSRNLTGLNRMIAFAALWLEHDGSSWNVIYVDAMGTLVEAESFTVTPVSTGVVDIEWEAGLLPAMSRKPVVMCTDGFGRGYGTVLSALSVEVRLHDEGGSNSNESFVVYLK